MISLLLALALVGPSGNRGAAAAATPTGVQLGVFTPDAGPGLAAFESEIGRKTDSFLWYQAIGDNLDTADLGPIAQSGHVIQLAWEPHDPNAADPVNQPAYQLRNITAGNFDADIHRWAQQLKNFGSPVIFRPMCEMNGNWVPWGGTVNGNQPQDYIPAWRHIHDIFVQEGATNVKFVWSPNQDNTAADAANTFSTYYPGDAYVDYVGIDGYNWGTMYQAPAWSSQWKSFTDTFAPSYDVAVARTSKPVIICETASTEQGGDKAQWISDMFAQLPVCFPRITSVTWFNINKETDWRVESSPASLAAFKTAVAPPSDNPGRDYYFGWYDDASRGMQSWIVIGNPEAATQHVQVFIGGQLQGDYNIGAGQRVTPQFPGVMNGPVRIVSITGGELLSSERNLFNSSFSEPPATPAGASRRSFRALWTVRCTSAAATASRSSSVSAPGTAPLSTNVWPVPRSR